MMRAKETVGNRNSDVKGKKKDGKPTRFSRMKKGLVAGLMTVATAATLGLAAGCSDTYKSNGDGGTSDASGLDANVTSDASGLDATVTPDASMLDGSVAQDAMVEVDSAVDSSVPTCPTGVNEERLGWFRPMGVAGTIGNEYEVTYSSFVDPNNITIDVDCVSNGMQIVTGEQLTRDQEAIIPLGGKNLRVTVTQLNVNNALMDATIE